MLKVVATATLSLSELEVFERELAELEERNDLFLEVDTAGLRLDPAQASAAFAAWPQVLQKTAAELLARGALTALTHLARTVARGEG